jgi:hypothetical protein
LKTDESWQADATFFVYSLRNLLRAAQLAAGCAPDASAAGDIQRHINTFEASLPSLVAMRDVLEHFDDYLEMKGKLQHPETPWGKRKPDAAIDPWEEKRKRRAPPGSFGSWAARQPDDDLLVGAGEFELRVDVAVRAAHDMATAILVHRSDE